MVEMLQNLISEKHTWRLITSIYRDRLETEAKGDVEESMIVDVLVSCFVVYTNGDVPVELCELIELLTHIHNTQFQKKKESEKQITMSMYEQEAAVRQAQLVIDWLEKNAEEELEDYYEKVEFFTDQSGAW